MRKSAAGCSADSRWQQKTEARADARCGFHRDCAAMAADDSKDGCQPEAAPGDLGGEERIKDAGERFIGHAAARVGNFDEDELTRLDVLPDAGVREILAGGGHAARGDFNPSGCTPD